jgi:acetylornithine deacetylase/succinyl-diaminopimelate desuccinylase-like protein
VQLTETNRAYFAGMAKVERAKGDTIVAKAMDTLVRNPNDEGAVALVSSKEPLWNSTLRTTCVATMLEAGHATNALPQRARANINCRIFPGVPPETVHAELEELVADPAVKVTPLDVSPVSPPAPLTPNILAPVEKLAGRFWPGVPVLPFLLQGASDGRYLTAAGIPTYGISRLFVGPDVGNIHGLNEYISVQSLMQSRDFLYRLVKIYADQG